MPANMSPWWPFSWAHIIDMDTVSLLCHYIVCSQCVCVCTRTFCPLPTEGGSQEPLSPSKKWQRRQPNLCSVPLSPSHVPHQYIDRSAAAGPRAQRISMMQHASETITCAERKCTLWIWITRDGCHWPFEAHAKVWMRNIASEHPSYNEAHELSAERGCQKWSLHRSQAPVCRRIRPRSAGRVQRSDTSLTNTINYPNNIKTQKVWTPRTHRRLPAVSGISLWIECTAYPSVMLIASTSFHRLLPYSHIWLDTFRPINFV